MDIEKLVEQGALLVRLDSGDGTKSARAVLALAFVAAAEEAETRSRDLRTAYSGAEEMPCGVDEGDVIASRLRTLAAQLGGDNG